MAMWNNPGRVKASRVQHVAPTRAMMLEKLGIINTTNPVIITIEILIMFWKKGDRPLSKKCV